MASKKPRTAAQQAALKKAQAASAAKRAEKAAFHKQSAANGPVSAQAFPGYAEKGAAIVAAHRKAKAASAKVKVPKVSGSGNHKVAVTGVGDAKAFTADQHWAARTYGGLPSDYTRDTHGNLVNLRRK